MSQGIPEEEEGRLVGSLDYEDQLTSDLETAEAVLVIVVNDSLEEDTHTLLMGPSVLKSFGE